MIEIIVLIWLVIIFIHYKKVVFVKANSQCYKLITTYNSSIQFKKIEKTIRYCKECSSKNKLENFNLDTYMLSLIEENPIYYNDLIESLMYNRQTYEGYVVGFNRILNEKSYEYKVKKRFSFVSTASFRKIECKECERIKLKPPTIDFTIQVTIFYTSPQGRKSYTHTFSFTSNRLEEYLHEYNQFCNFKESKKYQRALMTDKLRYKILQRDHFRCTICGDSQRDGAKLHVDHIKPVAKGGKTEESNLRTLCDRCNMGKRDMYDPNGMN